MSAGIPGVAGTPGLAGRWMVLAGGLLLGLVLAIALVSELAPWTAHGAPAHQR